MNTLKTMAAVAVMAGLFAAAPAEAGKKVVTGVVNLNTASAKELEALPGVGAKSAQAIIAYRAKAPFKRVDDLVRVKGIGKKKLEKMRPHLTVQGPTTISVQGPQKKAGKSKPQARVADTAPPRS